MLALAWMTAFLMSVILALTPIMTTIIYRMNAFRFISYCFFLLISLQACNVENERLLDKTPYVYQPPELFADNINVENASTHAVTVSRLEDLLNAIRQEQFVGIDSVLVAINNDLILEEYFAGWQRNDLHDLRSATKSITSLLTGIAIDQQLLHLNDEVYAHFQRYYGQFDHGSNDKERLQLKHMLNMSNGLACNDWWDLSPGNEAKMYRHDDWVKFILDLPMVSDPGNNFSYCTGGVQVVARMIENSSHMSLQNFAQEHLFSKLGISNYQWTSTGSGRTEASGHIYFRPRDMLKLGLLVVNNGDWQGQSVVSSQWMNQLHTPYFNFYGNFWWHQNFEPDDASFPLTKAIYASGNGGQQIWIMPDLQLVIVFTANNYNMGSPSREMIMNYILPAVHGL